jgi:hypothetical protein
MYSVIIKYTQWIKMGMALWLGFQRGDTGLCGCGGIRAHFNMSSCCRTDWVAWYWWYFTGNCWWYGGTWWKRLDQFLLHFISLIAKAFRHNLINWVKNYKYCMIINSYALCNLFSASGWSFVVRECSFLEDDETLLIKPHTTGDTPVRQCCHNSTRRWKGSWWWSQSWCGWCMRWQVTMIVESILLIKDRRIDNAIRFCIFLFSYFKLAKHQTVSVG